MAKSAYDIAPQSSFQEAARTALRKQLDELFENLPGTIKGDDIKALHDMRVASRRLRAAMAVFGDAFPAKLYRKLETQVAKVTDNLGTVRDADVLIEFVTQQCEQAPEAERVGIEYLLHSLKSQREQDRKHLVSALSKLEASSFQEEFSMMITDTEP